MGGELEIIGCKFCGIGSGGERLLVVGYVVLKTTAAEKLSKNETSLFAPFL